MHCRVDRVPPVQRRRPLSISQVRNENDLDAGLSSKLLQGAVERLTRDVQDMSGGFRAAYGAGKETRARQYHCYYPTRMTLRSHGDHCVTT